MRRVLYVVISGTMVAVFGLSFLSYFHSNIHSVNIEYESDGGYPKLGKVIKQLESQDISIFTTGLVDVRELPQSELFRCRGEQNLGYTLDQLSIAYGFKYYCIWPKTIILTKKNNPTKASP